MNNTTQVQKHKTLTELKALIPEGDEPLLPLMPECDWTGEYSRPGFIVG